MNVKYFGAHFDSSKFSIKECLDIVEKYGGNTIQILNNAKIRKEKVSLKKNQKIVIHTNYWVNIAGNVGAAISGITKDILLADKIGAFGVVIHTGKNIENNVLLSFKRIKQVFAAVAENTKDSNVKLILETSSGQGSELFRTMKTFTKVYSVLKSQSYGHRLGICIDTCHIFAAGYDIKNNFSAYIKYFQKLISLDEVVLIHLNDSKNDLDSRIDRHQNIGSGYIGEKALKEIFKFFSSKGVPVILETPKRLETIKCELDILSATK